MQLPSYLTTLLDVYAFCWGAVWGSFLNVVIWRLPRGASLVHPGSRCPACGSPIRPRDNVPILGWLVLRGRCRDCGVRISGRYPAIEALCGGLSLLLWWHVGADGRLASEPLQVVLMPFLFHFFFVMLLVAIAFIDLDLTIIPHELTLPGMVWGLLAGLLMPRGGAWMWYHPSIDWVDALVGLVAGGAFIGVVFVGYRAVTGRVGLGGGDATLLAMIGANLGWQQLPLVLLAGSLLGLVAAVGFSLWERWTGRGSLLIRGAWKPEFWDADPLEPQAPADGPRAVDPEACGDGEGEGSLMQMALPFGPFLALGALCALFGGGTFVHWLTAGAWP
jgi:leader peptidase (prepilin peptidase)/N-methyltransferase